MLGGGKERSLYIRMPRRIPLDFFSFLSLSRHEALVGIHLSPSIRLKCHWRTRSPVENTTSFLRSGQRSPRRVWTRKGEEFMVCLNVCVCALWPENFFSNSIMFVSCRFCSYFLLFCTIWEAAEVVPKPGGWRFKSWVCSSPLWDLRHVASTLWVSIFVICKGDTVNPYLKGVL